MNTQQQAYYEKQSSTNGVDVKFEHVAFMQVKCECGNAFEIHYSSDWKINIVGVMQFQCLKCNAVINFPQIW